MLATGARRATQVAQLLERPDVMRVGWWFLVALGVIGTLLRSRHRVFAPTLWAEDSSVFYRQAYTNPWRALGEPYNGYLHLLPRLVALLCRPFPLTWQPGLYAGAAVLVGLGVAACALLPGLAWLLPTALHRASLFVLLCVAPAHTEVTANIANLIFVGAVALVLVGLSDDAGGQFISGIEFAIVVVCGLSGPLAAIVLPVYVVRAWRARSVRSYLLVGAMVTVSAVQSALLKFGDSRTLEQDGSYRNLVDYLRIRLLPSWFVGENRLDTFSRGGAAPLGMAALVLALVLTVIVVRGLGQRRWMGVALLVTFALACLLPVRAYSSLTQTLYGQRHLDLPLAIVAICLVSAVSRLTPVLAVLATVLMIASVPGTYWDFGVPALPTTSTGGTEQCLERRLAATCILPAYPQQFSAQLTP